ncbi:transcription antitermination factor NusB [Lewinella cohaerens]|uniref:transcription antitermination factor NusB n=1 Tax=Lewinella cohaerens TaxID=70995 RepID=UPI000A033963|nr:transcription antitermination factor NusB [Lewinella cohaerens]
MLSRRNVRIKVMQVLYAKNREQEPTTGVKGAVKYYRRMVDDSFKLYLLNLLAFMRVAEYARQDKIRKDGKLRPTEADQEFSAKLANNEALQSLAKNFALTNAHGRFGLGQHLDADLIRKLYVGFSKTEAYKAYINQAESKEEDHRNILLELYRFLINNETFISMMEDQFPLWMDDKSLVVGAMKKTIKSLPVEEDFLETYEPQDETISEFGQELLEKVVDADKELLGIVEPNLKNWDAERVAILDMIILKMAIAEFLYFSSIPSKVTLNEFVEVAKLYSTDKSKDFINGVLDRLLKQLTEQGLVQKKGRGLKEE